MELVTSGTFLSNRRMALSEEGSMQFLAGLGVGVLLLIILLLVLPAVIASVTKGLMAAVPTLLILWLIAIILRGMIRRVFP